MSIHQAEASGSSWRGGFRRLREWMQEGTKKRRVLIAFAIYFACVAVFAAVAGKERLVRHTDANHFALLADAWIHGRQDLAGGAPDYTGHNDFVEKDGKTYISFPPFPAVLMLPFVKLAGSPEAFQDGQFIIWLAGIGPALLFLVLEKLRRRGRNTRSERQNVILALLFAFGTVYFFTAVQGEVWFAGHVVGVGLVSGYMLFALDAEVPWAAGLFLGCAWMTRTTTLLLVPLFALEAIRVHARRPSDGRDDGEPARIPWPKDVSLASRLRGVWERTDVRAVASAYAMFSLPIALSLALSSWMNFTRFHNASPAAFGHEYLAVYWAARIHDWGLFSLHYLPKNLGIVLTELPWFAPDAGAKTRELFSSMASSRGAVPFVVNEHGLALWWTTPLYFWLFRPRKWDWFYVTFLASAALPIAMNLLYQNSGWRQFGYRFSNDYSPLLFVLLALGDRPMKRSFGAAAAWGIAWNFFGAATFNHPETRKFYFTDGSQDVIYQPDCGSPVGPACKR